MGTTTNRPGAAWEEGYSMAVRGFTGDSNPYSRTHRAKDWLDGFLAACADGRWGSYTP